MPEFDLFELEWRNEAKKKGLNINSLSLMQEIDKK